MAMLGYANMEHLPNKNGNISPIRLQALRETATSLGARGALAWQSKKINKTLSSQSNYLDDIFNFNRLLIKQHILPPIIVESESLLNIADEKTIRMADKTYKIIQQARLITVPPTWRDYLLLHYKKPDLPHSAMLPHGPNEVKIWNRYLKEGWFAGVQQANTIFLASLNRLKRDYLGMVLYRRLLKEGVITSPTISVADLGITGNSNEMRINDAIMRITEKSNLQLDSRKWKAISRASTANDQKN